HALTHGLLRQAARRGARVFDRTTVLRYGDTRTGVKLETDRGATVRARRVVIAAGYEAATFLRIEGIRVRSTYALVTEPIASFPGWPGRRLVWETARPYFYARTTLDGRILMGG